MYSSYQGRILVKTLVRLCPRACKLLVIGSRRLPVPEALRRFLRKVISPPNTMYRKYNSNPSNATKITVDRRICRTGQILSEFILATTNQKVNQGYAVYLPYSRYQCFALLRIVREICSVPAVVCACARRQVGNCPERKG